MSEDRRISPRDAQELTACFAAHAADLFGHACMLARGDRALADDLVQAAFEVACWAWPALRDLAEEQRRRWLRTTAFHIAVSGFRRETALRDRLAWIEARYRKYQAEPSEQAFSSITLERCWQIIRGLPTQQHAVALLRWKFDMKEADIAAILEISPKTVSVHLYLVRRKLIAQLGPDNPFGHDDQGTSA